MVRGRYAIEVKSGVLILGLVDEAVDMGNGLALDVDAAEMGSGEDEMDMTSR